MNLFSDAPITGLQSDALGRKDVAERVVELIGLAGVEQPLVIGLVGDAGSGKTSVLRMCGELLAGHEHVTAFALDAWTGTTAKEVREAFLREVSRIFSEGKVASGADKLRERLFSLGDMVSTVARVAGVTVDVKGALERSPDQLREEMVKLTTALGKRIVVVIDHLDRLPGDETVTLLKMIERWGSFPYFAFVLGYDHEQVVRNLRHVDGDADAVERIVATELAMPPVDRVRLAAWIRGGVADLATSLRVDPAPALALFEVEDGVALEAITTVRQAKRLLNALVAAAPLLRPHLDLRGMCLLELIRQRAPDAYRAIVTHVPLDAERADRLRIALTQPDRPKAVADLIDQLLARALP